jgi:pimeloyl-ACP methyl ester carboxylesterase
VSGQHRNLSPVQASLSETSLEFGTEGNSASWHLRVFERTCQTELYAVFGSESFIGVGVASVVAALVLAAVVNYYLSKRAEHRNPPKGRFVDVDGLSLHYIDHGSGQAVVLLHGNGSMIQDFECSGLIGAASQKYRVVVFDRPGFGHTRRPRSTIWSAVKQADVIHRALLQIGISRATVLGHSWGASVAVALAVSHPRFVGSLVLISGYYYPTFRADVPLLSGPAIPVIGDVISYTVAPIISRLIWPLILRRLFAPAPVPEKFDFFPKEMAFRPSQLRASAEETALMIPGAFTLQWRYRALTMPVVILAGEDDRVVEATQSARLHREIRQSTFKSVTTTGHMVQQTATERVMEGIDEAVRLAGYQREDRERRSSI